MTSSARLDDLHQKFQEDPRRYFAPLANEYRKSGQAARAVELCRAHLPQQPGHLSGHVVLAQALHDLGELEAARVAYSDALTLDPENVLVIRSLGDVARQAGSVDTARDWYERAMGVDPRDPEVARRLAALEQVPAEPREGRETHAPDEMPASRDAEEPREEPAPVEISEAAEFLTEPILREELIEEAAAADEPGAADRWTEGDAGRAEERMAVGDEEGSPLGLREADVPHEERDAAEFTAGFFAAVLATPDATVQGPTIADRAEAEGTAPPPDAGDSDDIDRLFAELPSFERQPGSAGMEPDAAPPGTDLALADGGAIVPDVPDLVELDEVEQLRAIDAVEEASHGSLADAEPPAEPSVLDDGPVPLVADEWTMSLDSIGFEPEPTEYGATSSDPADAGATGSMEDVAARDPQEAPHEASVSDEPVAAPLAHGAEIYEEEPEPVGHPVAFVTETMAELYLRQGFHDQALLVYRQLLAQSPDDPALRDRVSELERATAATTAAEAVAGAATVASDEPPAATWLQRLATARPRSVEEPEPEAEPAAGAPDVQAAAEDTPGFVDDATDASPAAPDAPAPGIEMEAVERSAEMEAMEHSAAFEWATPGPESPSMESPSSDIVEDAAATDVVEYESFAAGDVTMSDGTQVAAGDEARVGDEPRVDGDESLVEMAVAEEVSEAEPTPVADDAVPVGEPERHGTVAEDRSYGVTEEMPLPDAVEDDPWIFEGELIAAGGQVAADEPDPATDVAGADDEWTVEPFPIAEPGVAAAEPLVEADGVTERPEPVTLDELFARPVSAAEEHAAGALAAATLSMQDDPDVEAQLREATAEDPAALQHLLRGTPRSIAALRQGTSFSFDQFFRVDEPTQHDSGEAAHAGRPPAEESGRGSASDEEARNDLADFHAWLSGLSKP